LYTVEGGSKTVNKTFIECLIFYVKWTLVRYGVICRDQGRQQ